MKLRIEQTLHGYFKGHGVLASSVPLIEPSDASLLATLSDWTGYRGATEEEDNYLTVYPLPSGKYMAFAKTWYAKEMERPGCVWTHTILVPIEYFQGRFDLRNLMKYFKRPSIGKYADYELPLELEADEVWNYAEEPIFSEFDKLSILLIFSVLLYNNKGTCFVIDRKQRNLQLFMLSILQYLPLHILLETSVSTGSEAIRKIGKQLFSLQFVSGIDADSLENGVWKKDLTEANFSEGLRFLYHEACKKNDETAYLIHLFDKDIEQSYKKYLTVLNLLRLLDEAVTGKEKVSYEDVLGYVFYAFPKSDEGKIVKSNFLGKKVTDFFCTDFECLKDIAKQKIDKDDWRYVHLEQRLSNLNHSELLNFATTLASNGAATPLSQVFLYAFDIFYGDEINTLVQLQWNQLKHLIVGNEDYIQKEYWLLLEKEHFNEYFLTLPLDTTDYVKRWDMLLTKVLDNETQVTEEWTKEIFAHVDGAVKIILDFVNKEVGKYVSGGLLDACVSHVSDCLDWMSVMEEISNEFLLDLLTSQINPNSREVRDCIYPYWRCLLNSKCQKPSYLSFAFASSFQQKDEVCIALLRKSFDCIYKAQSKGKFPQQYWNRIAYHVDAIKWVKDWDKCKRLCLFVISHLHERGYGKDVISKISVNRSIMERLFKFWGKTYKKY